MTRFVRLKSAHEQLRDFHVNPNHVAYLTEVVTANATYVHVHFVDKPSVIAVAGPIEDVVTKLQE
jgi:hypothetical protein